MTDLTTLESDLSGQITAAGDLAALEAVRVAALGKTGQVSLLLKSLGGMSPDERREQGPRLDLAVMEMSVAQPLVAEVQGGRFYRLAREVALRSVGLNRNGRVIHRFPSARAV